MPPYDLDHLLFPSLQLRLSHLLFLFLSRSLFVDIYSPLRPPFLLRVSIDLFTCDRGSVPSLLPFGQSTVPGPTSDQVRHLVNHHPSMSLITLYVNVEICTMHIYAWPYGRIRQRACVQGTRKNYREHPCARSRNVSPTSGYDRLSS